MRLECVLKGGLNKCKVEVIRILPVLDLVCGFKLVRNELKKFRGRP